MNKKVVFESTYGYNGVVRLGKIYTFTSNHYVFMMNIYKDLIDYSGVFHRFIKICKEKMKEKIFIFMFNPIKDLYDREVGIISVKGLMNKYYNIYFNKK